MLRHFDCVNSTNEAARLWARDSTDSAPHGALVTADSQSAGRGRHGRQWASPAGKGVYLTMVWRPAIPLEQGGRLAIIVALAASKALEEISGLKVQTKWPNDVMVCGRKIGGVLCESELEGSRLKFVIAGVGLNVNHTETDLPARPLYPATSLLLETGQEHCVQGMRSSLATQLEREYLRFMDNAWDAQRAEFIQRCLLIGERVRIDSAAGIIEGLALGMDESGSLVVQTGGGTVRVPAGDASLR